MQSGSQPGAIHERELEIRAIDDALTRVIDGSGTAIVIAGQPGMGTSTLLRSTAETAAAREISVLRARGGELERALPYGVVMELFGPLAREGAGSDTLFVGPARIVSELLGGPHEQGAVPGGQAGDPVAYLHGLIWLVLNLAERTPLAIVVDDAQWADEPSLRFLHALVDRIDELPVVVLLGMGPASDDPAGGPAERIRTSHAAIHLEPGPLTEAAVGRIMSDRLDRTVQEDLRRSVWETTGGNPFFVNELATELARAGPAGMSTAEVATFLPQRVGRYVDARLARAGATARALAEAAAVLGDHATLHRSGLVAGLDPEMADAAARQLVEVGLLGDSVVLTFRQPMVRSAVEARVPAPALAALRRRAALALADDGARPGIIGALLLDAAPAGDPRVVDLLLAAAEEAERHGELHAGAALLRRALDEPAAPDVRPAVLWQLARAEAAAGSPGAISTYADVIASTDAPDVRAAMRLELGHALVAAGQWAAARTAFARGLEEPPTDETLRGRLEAGYLGAAWVSMDEDRAVIGERVRQLLAKDDLGAANRELAVWIAFQQGAVVGSTASEMGSLVKRVLREAPIEALVREGQVIEVAAGLLLETDDLPLEIEILTAALDAAREHGPIRKLGVYAYCRAWPSYYMGRLTDAIADAEEALRAAALGWEAFVPAAATVACLARIERDELDAAEAVIGIDPDRWAGRIDTAMLLPIAAGRLALARGDIAGAAGHLRVAAEGAGTAFMRNTVPTDWRAWYAMVLLKQDRRDEARSFADEGVEIARAWGAAWPLGSALTAAGLVAGPQSGIPMLREAEELLRDSPARLERTRLLVSLGALLRRNGALTEARDVLRRGADLAHSIGARALLRQAWAELRAAGARPRRIALTGVESLTPGELRVAEEALAGRTNREIAQALFVTPKAVEFHLANTYRKLGIEARGELAGAMAAGGETA